MKNANHPARRAAWLFLAAPAFLATPASAQDAPTAPPPVSVTVPQSAAPAPAPAAPAPAAAGGTTASRTTIAPGAADVVDEARQPAPRAARPAPQATRNAPARSTAARAPAAAAPAPAPEPVAQTPTPAPQAITPAPQAVPVTETPAETATTDTSTNQTATNDTGPTLWPIALIAALIVVAGAAFLLMRRRRATAYDETATYHAIEPVYVEPVPAQPVAVVQPAYVAPVAAARVDAMGSPHHEPVAAGLVEEATVTDAPAEDVAALTDAAPPVRNRPWLEFAMRPVRAGTSADEALVEIELTVANSGTVGARDVRVSAFMLTEAHANETERMLVDTPADAAIEPIDIAPGEGTRIDATLAALKTDLGFDGHFNPVVVAEARYRLADGSEGRTAASFVVGISDAEGGAMIPIDLADRVMREDIEARLHGQVEHA